MHHAEDMHSRNAARKSARACLRVHGAQHEVLAPHHDDAAEVQVHARLRAQRAHIQLAQLAIKIVDGAAATWSAPGEPA